jgi:DNA polymerase-3 subunit alpha
VGRFASLHELCAEIDPRLVNKRVLEALVHAGALDSLGGRRSQLVAALDGALEFGQQRRAEREAGQGSLFGGPGSGEPVAVSPVLPELPEWDEAQRLHLEKAALGFYVSGHPLSRHRERLAAFSSHATSQLRLAPSGSAVRLGGMIHELRRRKSKKGAWWASFQLEDLEGQADVMVFPKAYETCQEILENDRPCLVSGRLAVEDERVRILADRVGPLDEPSSGDVEAVQLRLDAPELDAELVGRLRQVVESHQGETPLLLEVARPGAYRLVARAESALRVAPSRRLTEALESLVGPDRVHFRPKAPS